MTTVSKDGQQTTQLPTPPAAPQPAPPAKTTAQTIQDYMDAAAKFLTDPAYARQVLGINDTAPGLNENFADGRGPGRPGDSQRHGIPKKATMAQLQKAAKAPGRKGQLARWQINMRRGRKKSVHEEEMSVDQWRELRQRDPKTYDGTKDWATMKWWEGMYRMHEKTAREAGAKHFEFPPGSNMWFTVTKGPMFEDDTLTDI